MARGGFAALAGMRLVDNDRERPIPVCGADIGQDVGELLHRGDDDPSLEEVRKRV
jgi:hypothetical protein